MRWPRSYFSRFLFLGPCFLVLNTYSQSSLLFPPDYFFDVQRQKEVLADTTQIIHSSAQPFIYPDVAPPAYKHIKEGDDLFFDKILFDDLLKVRYVDKTSGYSRKFNLTINPVFNFSASRDVKDTSKGRYYNNTRGVWIKGEIGNKFRFETSFFENQSTLPIYLSNYANATEIVPGQGRWKTFKKTGYDYAMSNGVMHYQPSKNFFIRLGHGKQKIGNGYRSLLLSDNSFNYPYLQLTANFFHQKLQYSQTYALLMNLSDGGTKIPVGTERIYQKKAASFQHLSWQLHKKINLYFFQAMIWKPTDSNNVMHLNALYANPLIYSNLAAYGFNNQNYMLAGGGLELKPMNKVSVYGQYIFDGSYRGNTNTALQGGLKLFDALGISNLYLQAEFNYVSKYMYRNMQHPDQDYSHYNQSLATPAAFANEAVFLASYARKRFFIQLKENYSFGFEGGQSLAYFDGKIGYNINPRYNANLSVGVSLRDYQNTLISKTRDEMQLFYISFKTSLYNVYYDF